MGDSTDVFSDSWPKEGSTGGPTEWIDSSPRATLPRHEPTFQELLEFLYTQRVTGTLTLHFRSGRPRLVDFGGNRYLLKG